MSFHHGDPRNIEEDQVVFINGHKEKTKAVVQILTSKPTEKFNIRETKVLQRIL